jgi:8-amino-7-oxononanoate synthase
VGSGASSLVCGRSTAHLELEEEVARFTGRDKALVFSSGYLANLSIITTLAKHRRDCIFQDRLNHASIIDAAMLSPAKLVRYPHSDAEALAESLAKEHANFKLVLTDSVFSMDGDMAPLDDLAGSCEINNACLAVDDAHGFGVFGRQGKGLLDHLHLGQNEVPLLMATFGKALGCAGAFVAGQESLVELLVQQARPYIYSTALAPALAVAAKKGLQLIQTESWRQENLFAMIKRFRQGASQAGLKIENSNSPIQPLIVGDPGQTTRLSDALLEKGFMITAIRPPTVPSGTSRLRITITASHTETDIDQLIEALGICGKEMGEEKPDRV